MKQRTKLSQGSEEQQQAAAHHIHPQSGHEFASVEELLRFDAAHTNVPPQVAERLTESAREVPPPPSKPWWKNIFG